MHYNQSDQNIYPDTSYGTWVIPPDLTKETHHFKPVYQKGNPIACGITHKQ